MKRPQDISAESSWRRLCDEVRQTVECVGRRAEEIQIILVSKTVDEGLIRAAQQAGAVDFGENRVQELLSKKKNLSPDLRWHLIGHLQTNKVKQVLGQTVLIHSLDRVELAEVIDSQAKKLKIPKTDCLIQVNVSGEASKFGFRPEEVEPFLASLPADSAVEIRGLMVIGPHTEDEREIRKVFSRARQLQDQLKKKFPIRNLKTLSMGMSGDWRIAVEEGSTMIRVGSAVFGERNQE